MWQEPAFKSAEMLFSSVLRASNLYKQIVKCYYWTTQVIFHKSHDKRSKFCSSRGNSLICLYVFSKFAESFSLLWVLTCVCNAFSALPWTRDESDKDVRSMAAVFWRAWLRLFKFNDIKWLWNIILLSRRNWLSNLGSRHCLRWPFARFTCLRVLLFKGKQTVKWNRNSYAKVFSPGQN